MFVQNASATRVPSASARGEVAPARAERVVLEAAPEPGVRVPQPRPALAQALGGRQVRAGDAVPLLHTGQEVTQREQVPLRLERRPVGVLQEVEQGRGIVPHRSQIGEIP
ncbi:hypothetical protein ACIBO5_50140 [Nonomuraea angiospora]|uniref:hypothetical protein n=1 Tax=Nonomuraea angiospora TaxID=46172 RepID=UPI0037B91087